MQILILGGTSYLGRHADRTWPGLTEVDAVATLEPGAPEILNSDTSAGDLPEKSR